MLLDSDPRSDLRGAKVRAESGGETQLLALSGNFMFQRTPEEAAALTPQIVIASPESETMRSQIVTASKRNVRHPPFAFTEHGALQAANILKSERAAAMSVFVIRAFVQMREQLTMDAAGRSQREYSFAPLRASVEKLGRIVSKWREARRRCRMEPFSTGSAAVSRLRHLFSRHPVVQGGVVTLPAELPFLSFRPRMRAVHQPTAGLFCD